MKYIDIHEILGLYVEHQGVKYFSQSQVDKNLALDVKTKNHIIRELRKMRIG